MLNLNFENFVSSSVSQEVSNFSTISALFSFSASFSRFAFSRARRLSSASWMWRILHKGLFIPHLTSKTSYSPVQPSKAQPSTVQKSPVQPSTVQYGPVQRSTATYSPIQPSTVQYSSVQSSTAQEQLAQYSLVQLSKTDICGLIANKTDLDKIPTDIYILHICQGPGAFK